MAYSYNPNVPQSNQTLAATQQPIQNNFNTINEVFGINHVQFTSTDASLQGKHNFCSFPTQASDPATTTTELALYTKETSSLVSLYLRSQNNGAINLFQPSSSTVTSTSYSFLSNAQLMIQGGIFSYTPVTGTIITFPIAFSTHILGFFVNPIATNSIVFTVLTSTTQAVLGGPNACTVNWMAIGY